MRARIDFMLERGVIKEVEKVYNTCWDKKLPFAKAIGAEDIVNYLNGEIGFEKLSQNCSETIPVPGIASLFTNSYNVELILRSFLLIIFIKSIFTLFLSLIHI